MNRLEYWKKWAYSLQQSRMTGFVLTLLEGAAPIRMILSQTLFGVSPFIASGQQSSFTAFAETLEDPQECQSFAEFLRNGEL